MRKFAKRKLTIIIGFSVWIWSGNAFSAGMIDLDHDHAADNVGRSVKILAEPSGGWHQDQALAAFASAPHYADTEINLGYQATPNWLSFKLNNTTDTPGEWLLMTMRTSLDLIEVYQVVNGQPQRIYDYADADQRRSSLQRYFGIATPVGLEPGEKKQILIRFRAITSGWLPMVIVPNSMVPKHILSEFAFRIFTTASVLAIIGLNLLYFFFTRQTIFAWYCASTTAILISAAHLQGLTTVFLFYDNPALGRVFGAIVITLASILMTVFAARFLGDKVGSSYIFQHYYRLVLWVGGGYLLVALGFAFSQQNNFDAYVAVGWGLAALTYIVLPLHALIGYLGGNKAALPLFVGWSLYGVFIIITVASSAGLIQPWSEHWLLLSPVTLAESILVAIALALSVRNIDEERALLQVGREVALNELADNARLVLAVGHDSRNMLTSIEQLGAEIHRTQDPVKSSEIGAQLQVLAEDLNDTLSLLISEVRTGLVESSALAIETVSTKDLFATMALLFGKPASNKGVELNFKSQVRELAGDRKIITRVLANLIDNALKYGDDSKILVTCRDYQTGYRFQVWNNGVGMAEHELLDVIDRGHNGIRKNPDIPGEGAGLSICWQLVRKLGGQMIGASKPNKATMFGFELPYPDIDAIQSWQIGVLQPNTTPNHLSNIVGILRQSSGPEFEFKINIWNPEPSSVGKASTNNGEQLVISTYDRSRDFRRKWESVADCFLYLPTNHEATVCALNAAARKHR